MFACKPSILRSIATENPEKIHGKGYNYENLLLLLNCQNFHIAITHNEKK